MPDHPVQQAVLSLIKDGTNILRVTFGPRQVEVGEKVPKGEAQNVPTLSWKKASSGSKLMVVCLDLDAPFPLFAPLGPVLHWLQTGFTLDAATGNLSSSDPAIALYAGPGPPPISSPHRYVFSLYEQPADFDPKSFIKPGGYGIRDRMRYDFEKLEKQAKLGSAVAGTYFVSN